MSFTGYRISDDRIYGPHGYTQYRILSGRIYGPSGYAQTWINDSGRIYSTSGYTGCWVNDGRIFGRADQLPWEQE
jgi:hypothetical protein